MRGDNVLKDTSARAFETGWRLGTFGSFRLASAVCPHEIDLRAFSDRAWWNH
jgi:hypothetical protein